MRKSQCLPQFCYQCFVLVDFSSWDRVAHGGMLISQNKERSQQPQVTSSPFLHLLRNCSFASHSQNSLLLVSKLCQQGKGKEGKESAPTPLRFLLLLYDLSHLKIRFVPSRDAVDWN